MGWRSSYAFTKSDRKTHQFELQPMTTLLHHANLCRLSHGEDYGRIEQGAIVIDGERIAWVGLTKDLPTEYQAADLRYDCEGKLVTPGLIDCHTHLVYAGNRAKEFEQRLEGVSYEEISRRGGGIMSTVRATRLASEADLVKQSRRRLEALLEQGVTTVEIKSGYGLARDQEIKMLRAAGQLGGEYAMGLQRSFLAAHALPPEYSGRKDAYIDAVCDEMLPAAWECGLVDAVDAFCEGIGFTLAQTERVFIKARELGLPIKCHAEQLIDLGGAAMSARHGALSVDHLEYLNPEDIKEVARGGSVAVLLPGAFYVLKETRLPPLQGLREQGVPIALATDCNPGSSPLFSPLITMNLGCTLFAMTPLEALAGFTIHAAKALGLDDQVGSIDPGKQADLVLWNCDHPAELSYHIGLNPCFQVMQQGQWRTHH